jgi:hypothetical protein
MKCQCIWCHAQVLVLVTPGVLQKERRGYASLNRERPSKSDGHALLAHTFNLIHRWAIRRTPLFSLLGTGHGGARAEHGGFHRRWSPNLVPRYSNPPLAHAIRWEEKDQKHGGLHTMDCGTLSPAHAEVWNTVATTAPLINFRPLGPSLSPWLSCGQHKGTPATRPDQRLKQSGLEYVGLPRWPHNPLSSLSAGRGGPPGWIREG